MTDDKPKPAAPGPRNVPVASEPAIGDIKFESWVTSKRHAYLLGWRDCVRASGPEPKPAPEPYLGCMRHMWTDDGTEGCPTCADENEREDERFADHINNGRTE